MKLKRLVIMTLTLTLMGAVMVTAAPSLIDYQGYLEDNTGAPITDTLSITFTIYDASTSGNSKWTETQSSVEILGGLFNVTLGSSTAILDTVFNGDTRYLAINLGGSDLSPRTRIVSSAYSHRVNTVDGASGGTITSDLEASGTIKGNRGNFGHQNTVLGLYSLVAGQENSADGQNSAITGGRDNEIIFTKWYSFIGGGRGNYISEDYVVIGGGFYDTALADYSVIGGGRLNKTTGIYSVIPGGYLNLAAGSYSFAAGRRAKANHDGVFVWADSYDGDFSSSAANQFNVRSSGGVRIFTNTGLTAGVTLSAGGSSWSSVSDSTLKRNIRIIDGHEIITKLMQLPIKRWSYKAQSPDIEHIGPMAQDFYSVFGIGEDNKTISSIDPSGIALAAIQEVYRQVLKLQEKNKEIELLKSEFSKLQEQVNSLARHIEKNTTGANNRLASVDSE